MGFAPTNYVAGVPTNSGTAARPTPATWQDKQYQDAQDAWNAQGAGVYGAEAGAKTAQDAATAASGSALGRLGALNPTNTQGYNPTDLANFDSSKFLTGPGSAASDMAAGYAANSGGPRIQGAGVGGAGYADAKKAALAIGDFDPTAYGTTFAQGAESEFNTNLGTQLDALQRKSAGTGRLETGFYTGDQGKVATNLGQDFNDKLSQAATTFSGQRLTALQGSASALTGIDADIASNNLDATKEADYSRLTTQQQAISAKLAEQGMTVSEQQQAASLGLTQAQMLAQLQLTKAQGLDNFNLNKTSTGLDAALREEQMARSSYSSAAGAAGAYTSASRDWAAQDKQTQDEIDFHTAVAKYLAGLGGKPSGPGGPNLPPNTGTGGAGPAQDDPYAWLKTEAKQLGVPFGG